MPKRISVIIPTYRDSDRLALCLKALSEQTLPADEFEVIVVNNDPDDRLPSPDVRLSNCIIVDERRPGSYSARNKGLSLARGKYLAFTDSDCLPAPDWLERGLQRLDAEPRGRVAGAVRIFREPNSSYLAHLYESHTAFPQKTFVNREQCGVTANLLVARAVLDEVGPFNAALFSGGDFEWNRRANVLGIPISYDENVVVHHPARRTMTEILGKERRVTGTHARDNGISSLRYVIRKLVPPLRPAFTRRPAGLHISIMVYLMLWFTRITAVHEFILVRSGLKKPRRA